MNRKALIYGIAAMAFLSGLATAQKPADAPAPPAAAAPAPQKTPAEAFHLQILDNRYRDLQKQADAIKEQQDAVRAEYQETSKQINAEHPGFQLDPSENLVPIPPAKKDEPAKAAAEPAKK